MAKFVTRLANRSLLCQSNVAESVIQVANFDDEICNSIALAACFDMSRIARSAIQMMGFEDEIFRHVAHRSKCYTGDGFRWWNLQQYSICDHFEQRPQNEMCKIIALATSGGRPGRANPSTFATSQPKTPTSEIWWFSFKSNDFQYTIGTFCSKLLNFIVL